MDRGPAGGLQATVGRIAFRHAALWLTAAAGILRFYQLGNQSFWYDEAVSVDLAGEPLWDLVTGRAKDLGNPPLYPMLLRLWVTVFGAGDVAVRGLSALLGTLAVPLVLVVGRRTVGPAAALLGTIVFVCAPFQLQMAQEARAYALLVLLGTASLAALLWALHGDADADGPARAYGRWLLYGAAAGCLVLTHYFGFFVLAGQAGYLLFVFRRQPSQLGRPLAAYGVAAVVFAVWLPSLLAQVSAQGNLQRSAESWHLHLLATPLVFGVGSTLVWKDITTWPRIVAGALALLVLVGTAALGLWKARRGASRFGLLASALVVPIALPALISLLASPLYNTRYVIVATVPFYLFVGAGLLALPRRVGLAAGALLALLFSASHLHYWTKPVKHQWRGAAAFVEAQRAPTDLLLFDADHNETAYDHYARASRGRVRLHAPPAGAAPGHLFGARHAGDDIVDVTALIQKHPRVWLILSDADEEAEERAQAFFARWRQGPSLALRGISIRRYDVRSETP